jgi:sugar lactone lactonase YvrE
MNPHPTRLGHIARRSRLLVASLAAAALLVACGGGGGGSGDPVVPPPGGGGAGPVPSLVAVAGRPGGYGMKDANGADARFGATGGQAVDAAGNVFVADSGNNLIRRINPAGDVVTWARGFLHPAGMAIDAQGNLYVADRDHHRIARVSAAGVVSTWAGTGTEGFTNGPADAAQFSFPTGVAVDANGTVYVSDTGNMVIRKITPDRVVSKLAGQVGWNNRGFVDGAADAARFSTPGDLALDGAGNLLVADLNNDAIRTVDAAGKVGTLAKVGLPSGIAVRAGAVYVSQATDNTVLRISAGTATVVAGVATQRTGRFAPAAADGPALAATFRVPGPLAFDAAGNLFIADFGTVRKLNTQGVVSTFAGAPLRIGATDGNAADASFFTPDSLAVDASGNLYVSDFDNYAIRKIAGGVVSTFASASPPQNVGVVSYPTGMLADGAGKLDVLLANRGLVLVSVDAAGKLGQPRSTGTFISGPGVGFSAVANRGAMVRDAAGNLYLTDQNYHVVRKVDTAGNTTVVAGEINASGAADGTGAAARFKGPVGLAIDAAGNLYVADTGNHAIRRITPAGVVSTWAGALGTAGDADGSLASARFNKPWQLAFDAAGNLLVTDQGNGLVRKITPAGVVSTVVGQRGKRGIALGSLATATLNTPSGILVGSQGEIYLTDIAENMVLKITAP